MHQVIGFVGNLGKPCTHKGFGEIGGSLFGVPNLFGVWYAWKGFTRACVKCCEDSQESHCGKTQWCWRTEGMGKCKILCVQTFVVRHENFYGICVSNCGVKKNLRQVDEGY